MANRSTKAKNKLIEEKVLEARRNGGTFKCPPRRNGQKDFSRYSSFPGFRKESRQRDDKPTPRIYKEN